MSVLELLAQLRATRASLDASIAALEAELAGATVTPVDEDRPTASRAEAVAAMAAHKKREPGACPNCGAPRSHRQEFGGYGGSTRTEICGKCAHEF